MRPRYLFIIILPITIFTVFLVLRAAGSLPHNTVPQTNPLLDQLTPVDPVEVQVDPRALISTTTEPEPTHELPLKEGSKLLESHCTQCHTVQWLAQIEKSRAEWEKTLAQMEAMGVRLEEPEKAALLDYFTADDQP